MTPQSTQPHTLPAPVSSTSHAVTRPCSPIRRSDPAPSTPLPAASTYIHSAASPSPTKPLNPAAFGNRLSGSARSATPVTSSSPGLRPIEVASLADDDTFVVQSAAAATCVPGSRAMIPTSGPRLHDASSKTKAASSGIVIRKVPIRPAVVAREWTLKDIVDAYKSYSPALRSACDTFLVREVVTMAYNDDKLSGMERGQVVLRVDSRAHTYGGRPPRALVQHDTRALVGVACRATLNGSGATAEFVTDAVSKATTRVPFRGLMLAALGLDAHAVVTRKAIEVLIGEKRDWVSGRLGVAVGTLFRADLLRRVQHIELGNMAIGPDVVAMAVVPDVRVPSKLFDKPKFGSEGSKRPQVALSLPTKRQVDSALDLQVDDKSVEHGLGGALAADAPSSRAVDAPLESKKQRRLDARGAGGQQA